MELTHKILFLLIISHFNLRSVECFEPISTTVAGLIGAFGLTAIYSSWDYLKCSSKECCHKFGDNKALVKGNNGLFDWRREPWIDYQLKQFEFSLNTRLYGQHLVKNTITKLIRKHLINDRPDKALVLSFHGWTGGGKNFVARILAKSIFRKYRESLKSDFVHEIISTHFNSDNKMDSKNKIKSIITKGVQSCERSLFIFDEIDKLDPDLIDVIKPFIDYNTYIDGLDYKKSIFIFLSNAGGSGINKLTYDFYLEGKDRADLTIKDLEPLINSGIFNEKGGLYKSDIVDKNLIDAFVPFLPLERKHVELCIIDYLKEHYNKSNPLEDPGKEFIRNVANQMEYFPPDTKVYSKTGCKRVAAKVDVFI